MTTMNEKTKYSRVSTGRQTSRMKTPEMLYQQLDRITDYRFCKRDKLTEEERAIIVEWGKKMHEIVKRYISNIYAIAGVEDMMKCDCKRANDIYYNYYVSTEEYMNYGRSMSDANNLANG